MNILLGLKNFSGDFSAEIVQKPYFDTRLTAPEGKSGVAGLDAFFVSAGSVFVHLFNQVPRRAVRGDLRP